MLDPIQSHREIDRFFKQLMWEKELKRDINKEVLNENTQKENTQKENTQKENVQNNPQNLTGNHIQTKNAIKSKL